MRIKKLSINLEINTENDVNEHFQIVRIREQLEYALKLYKTHYNGSFTHFDTQIKFCDNVLDKIIQQIK